MEFKDIVRETKRLKGDIFSSTHTVDDSTIKESMMIHACAVMAGYKFEEFIGGKLVDSEAIGLLRNQTAFIIPNLPTRRDSIGGCFKICELEKGVRGLREGVDEIIYRYGGIGLSGLEKIFGQWWISD